MKLPIALGFLASTLLIQGCNAGPETPKPVNKSTASPGTSYIKAANSPSTRDQEFAELLTALEKRNPQTEAQQAIASGKPTILGYYSGRAGLKTPGLTTEQQAKQRCKLDTVDGLGDVIYGENHMRYRIAIRNFAKAYNSSMLTACL